MHQFPVVDLERLAQAVGEVVSIVQGTGVGDGGVQLQETVTGVSPSEPEKVNVPFWQGISAIVTFAELPGFRVPLAARLKVTLLPRLVVTLQFTVPPVALRPTVHW